MTKKLGKEFFTLPAEQSAPLLLGKVLCRRLDDGRVLKGVICETECYVGEIDSACHARFGKTLRTQPMYFEGGVAYIYLCYGIHYLFNIVSGKAEQPEAVLIRGVADAKGPGRLTKLFNIDKSLNCEDLTTSQSIWIEHGEEIKFEMEKLPRVGIEFANEYDRQRLWRFVLKN